tara:strand:+ start:43 stop:651 length:609 start_codon:yes stop_codon:yes gene_type:complete
MSDRLESPNLNNIKEALTCSICQEVVTLPVHSTCCERAKSMNPGCLSCVRGYYELNKKPRERTPYKKSWGGCGCDVYTQNPSSRIYNHTTQLDMIRNAMGPSICYNCGVACETAAELRRHLTGASTPNDKHDNCPDAITKCKYCNLYGKYSYITGDHYKLTHDFINCDVCNMRVFRINLVEHYMVHYNHLKLLKKKIPSSTS